MTKSSSSDHNSDSPTGVTACNRKHRSDRRPLRFWQPFNNWWRDELERTGRRPCSEDIHAWYKANSANVWKEAAPTLNETRVHAKCLRSLPLVRNYFREYRAKKKTGQQGRPAESQGTSVGHASETEQQSPSSRSQLSPATVQPSISAQTHSLTQLEVQHPLAGISSLQQSLPSFSSADVAAQLAAAAAAVQAKAAATIAALNPVWAQQLLLSSLGDLSDPNVLTLLHAAALQRHHLIPQQQMSMVAQSLQTQHLHATHNNAAVAQAAAAVAAVQAQAHNQYMSRPSLNPVLPQASSMFQTVAPQSTELPCHPQPFRPTPRLFDKFDPLPFAHSSAVSASQLLSDKPHSLTPAPPGVDLVSKLGHGQVPDTLLNAIIDQLKQKEQAAKAMREELQARQLGAFSSARNATAGLV